MTAAALPVHSVAPVPSAACDRAVVGLTVGQQQA